MPCEITRLRFAKRIFSCPALMVLKMAGLEDGEIDCRMGNDVCAGSLTKSFKLDKHIHLRYGLMGILKNCFICNLFNLINACFKTR